MTRVVAEAELAGQDEPPVPMYSYRARAYPWAQKAIAAVQTVHGEPFPTRLCGKRLDEDTARFHELCEKCRRVRRG